MRFTLPKFLGDPSFIDYTKSVGQENALKSQYESEKTGVKSLASQYADSLKKLGQVQEQNIPLRQANDTQAGLMFLGDLLRNVTSTVPESQRQNIPSSLGTFRQLSIEDQQRLQQEEARRVQNQRNALLANAQAEEAKYNAAKDVLGMTQQDLVRAQQEEQFRSSQFQQNQQFNRQEARLEAGQKFDQFIRTEGLNLDKDQFDEVKRHNSKMEEIAGESEAAKQGRNFADLVKMVGPDGKPLFTAEEAMNMTYGTQIKIAEDLKRQREMNKVISPTMEAQHILDTWAQQDAEHKAKMGEIRAATAAHNRANQPTLTATLSPAAKQDVVNLGKDYSTVASSITDAMNKINAITADNESYDTKTGKLKEGALTRINGLRKQGKDLKEQLKDIRAQMGAILGNSASEQDIDAVIGEVMKAFGTGG